MNIPAFMPYIWLTVLVLSVVTEAITSSFIAICLFPAALAAIAVSLFSLPLGVQIAVFAAVAAAAVVLRFTLGEKRLKERADKAKMLESYIGRSALVTDMVTGSHAGHIEIDGRLWPAVAGEGKEFKKGDTVYICEYSANRFICK